ncbi:MAG: hypothetical protein Q4A82_05285 [Corynebacterium sp.]|nr:hypothetical protein [Corynebacterium sp.]
MLITDIEIRDFKTIKHLKWNQIPEHGVFVLHGENEQGKSTVLEALAQVLHSKHSSKTQAIWGTQPVGRDVGPQVAVTMHFGDTQVHLTKQWLKTPRAELTVVGQGSYTGGDAEERFADLFRTHVDDTLFTVLYNRQGSLGTELALGGITPLTHVLEEASGGSGDIDAQAGPLMQRITEEYLRFYTRRGKFTKQFQVQHDQVAAVGAAVAEAATKLEKLHQHVTEVERITQAQAKAEQELPLQQVVLRDYRQEYEAARQVEQKVLQVDKDQELARLQLVSAKTAVTKRAELNSQHQAATARVDKLTAEMADLQQAAQAETTRMAELTAARTAAVTAEKQAQADVRAATATRDAAVLRKRRAELTELQRKLTDIAAERRKLQAVPKVTADTVAAYEQAETAVQVARRTQAVRAPKLTLHAEAATPITLNDESLSITNLEHLITDTTTFTIGDVIATISPGAGDAETKATLTQAQEALTVVVETHGFPTAAAAKQARDKYTEAQAELKVLNTRQDVLLGDMTSAELAAELETELPEAPAEETSIADAETQLAAAHTRAAEATAAREQADAALVGMTERPAAQALAVHQELLAAAQETATQAAESLTSAIAKTPDADLQVACDAAASHLAMIEAQCADLAVELAEADPETKKQLYDAAQEKLESLENQVRNAATSIAAERSYIDAYAGVAEEYDRLQAEHMSAERRLAAAMRRSRAAKLLYEVVVRQQKAAHARYAQPFVDELARLARPVFGSGVQFVLDDSLHLAQRISPTGTMLDVSLLSGGAQEQLAILTRFAIASLVSDIQVPVFFDDALGSSDAQRLLSMGAVFGEMGKTRQVFVLTCAPERYASVRGRIEQPLKGLQFIDE